MNTSSFELWTTLGPLISPAVTGLLAFFLKGAFDDLKASIVAVASDVRALKDATTSLDKGSALLELRITTLEHKCDACERRISELSEGHK